MSDLDEQQAPAPMSPKEQRLLALVTADRTPDYLRGLMEGLREAIETIDTMRSQIGTDNSAKRSARAGLGEAAKVIGKLHAEAKQRAKLAAGSAPESGGDG
jgi:hypothetical protein